MQNQGWVALKTDTVEVDGKTYKTRHWLMDPAIHNVDVPRAEAQARHQEYYSQFGTPAVRRILKNWFKSDEIAIFKKAIQDGHDALNADVTGIPLSRWDSLKETLRLSVGSLVNKTQYAERPKNLMAWSTSEAVCIGKCVMRDMIEKGEV